MVLPILLIQDTYISYINKFGHVYTKSIKKKGIQKLNHKETTREYKNGLGLCTCDTHIHIHTMNVSNKTFSCSVYMYDYGLYMDSRLWVCQVVSQFSNLGTFVEAPVST